MICNNCYIRSNCEALPDKDGRCRNYLKDGEICFSDELKFNPSGSVVYDYDVIKKVFSSNMRMVRTNSNCL